MKRALDVLGAGVGLVVFSPVQLAGGVLVWLRMGWPVFFLRTRPGMHGAPFRMIKFRTMRDAVDADSKPLPDAERLTWAVQTRKSAT